MSFLLIPRNKKCDFFGVWNFCVYVACRWLFLNYGNYLKLFFILKWMFSCCVLKTVYYMWALSAFNKLIFVYIVALNILTAVWIFLYFDFFYIYITIYVAYLDLSSVEMYRLIIIFRFVSYFLFYNTCVSGINSIHVILRNLI